MTLTGREEDHLRTALNRYAALQAPTLDPLLSQCAVHEVAWYGPGPCWCCEPEEEEVKRG